MYNKKLEYKIRQRRIRIRKRKLSTHRIFVSKGEFKHTNNLVIINIYIYNRQKLNYLYKIRKKKIQKKKRKIKVIIDEKEKKINNLKEKLLNKNILLKKNYLMLVNKKY
jgi:hypothetical protein